MTASKNADLDSYAFFIKTLSDHREMIKNNIKKEIILVSLKQSFNRMRESKPFFNRMRVSKPFFNRNQLTLDSNTK